MREHGGILADKVTEVADEWRINGGKQQI